MVDDEARSFYVLIQMTGFDARAVANLILDEAEHKSRRLSNLALQKLLYFSHGLYLVQTGRPLVTGYFEAWQFGPVHPVVYEAFKLSGEKPIEFRASRFDIVKQCKAPLPIISDADCKHTISRVLDAYGKLSPSRLVELSHTPNAPWAFVVENSKLRPMLGLRITDNVIRERFKFHKFAVGIEPKIGDIGNEAPFD